MTKAYKVVTGYEEDFYGYTTDVEIAKYFFNKADAEAEYKKGEYTYKETAIYTTFNDGTVGRATTGANWYENAKKKQKRMKEQNLKKQSQMLTEWKKSKSTKR